VSEPTSETVAPAITNRNQGSKPWQFRRTIIIMSLVFCATLVTYLALYGDDTRLNETLVLGAFGLGISVIGSAVFGAVWDDKNTLKNRQR
jgi:hypothetical protein